MSAHSLRWKVLDKFCAHGTGIAVGLGNLAPDDAKVGLLGLAGNSCLFFGPVNVGALLADVPGSLLLSSTSLHLEESGIFPLVGQTAQVQRFL